MLARLERRDGDLGMRVARRADVDEVDVGTGDEGPPVGLDVLPVEAARHVAGGLGVTAADRDEVGHQGGVEEAAGVAPALRVGDAHERVADHADADPARRAHGGRRGVRVG